MRIQTAPVFGTTHLDTNCLSQGECRMCQFTFPESNPAHRSGAQVIDA